VQRRTSPRRRRGTRRNEAEEDEEADHDDCMLDREDRQGHVIAILDAEQLSTAVCVHLLENYGASSVEAEFRSSRQACGCPRFDIKPGGIASTSLASDAVVVRHGDDEPVIVKRSQPRTAPALVVLQVDDCGAPRPRARVSTIGRAYPI